MNSQSFTAYGMVYRYEQNGALFDFMRVRAAADLSSQRSAGL